MNIAIMGAPGSGKSELAQALKERFDQTDQTTGIVDDYAERIATEADLASGPGATYIGNLFILLGRLQQERQAYKKGFTNVITCGTMIDTALYATIDAVQGQSEPHWVRITNFMSLAGSFFQDTFNYDRVFVLSLTNPKPDTFAGQMDKNMLMAVSQFGVNEYVSLTGSLEERVEKAWEAIQNDDEETVKPEDFLQAPAP